MLYNSDTGEAKGHEVTLAVPARIIFGPMLHSKWLVKCCVVTLMNSCVIMLCITNGHLLFVMGALILKEFKSVKLDKRQKMLLSLRSNPQTMSP